MVSRRPTSQKFKLTWRWLEVWRFGLDQSGVNIRRAAEPILVDDMMLGCCTNQPDVFALNEESTATENIKLRFVDIIVQLMVSVPKPDILRRVKLPDNLIKCYLPPYTPRHHLSRVHLGTPHHTPSRALVAFDILIR